MKGTIPKRLFAALAIVLALLAIPTATRADPEDIAAAARGVVRVVVRAGLSNHEGTKMPIEATRFGCT